MNEMQRIINGLSMAARMALESAPSDAVGKRVDGTAAAIAELQMKELLAAGGGLTVKGSIIAMRVRRQMVEDAL